MELHLFFAAISIGATKRRYRLLDTRLLLERWLLIYLVILLARFWAWCFQSWLGWLTELTKIFDNDTVLFPGIQVLVECSCITICLKSVDCLRRVMLLQSLTIDFNCISKLVHARSWRSLRSIAHVCWSQSLICTHFKWSNFWTCNTIKAKGLFALEHSSGSYRLASLMLISLLVIKVLAMGPLTARHRFKHLVSASELMEIVRAKVKNSA